jgi:hypothetical protein
MYNTKKEKISDIVKEDIITSCFSSKKKIMKIIGITFVPFIYAFTCILAF